MTVRQLQQRIAELEAAQARRRLAPEATAMVARHVVAAGLAAERVQGALVELQSALQMTLAAIETVTKGPATEDTDL